MASLLGVEFGGEQFDFGSAGFAVFLHPANGVDRGAAGACKLPVFFVGLLKGHDSLSGLLKSQRTNAAAHGLIMGALGIAYGTSSSWFLLS
jgi:hypothetical protein